METELGKKGAFIDGLYFCPHHPDRGFPGERAAYKCACACRKPAPGMLLQAAKDFNIDITSSYMIGDSEKDVIAGEKAGCKKSFLIDKNRDVLDCVSEIVNKG